MRKKILILFLAFTMAVGVNLSAQNPAEVDFTVLTDEDLESKFYPCLAIWNATLEDPSDIYMSFYLNAPNEGDVIRVVIEETELNKETIVQEVANKAGEMEITPIIKWNYNKLSQLAQGGTTTMTCILLINGKEIDRKNHIVRYRPINECVFGFMSNDEWIDTSEIFSMYVNEDYPMIDKVLQSILSKDPSRSFIDYQGDAQDFINQLMWVWEFFSDRGTRYSNVVNTSNVSENVGLQYVRFIDQVIDNTQANCVDGSVVLASIYRKIGLDPYLVFIPGHCFLAIYYPGELSMEQGSTDPEDGGLILIETTLMGASSDYSESFSQAIEVVTVDEFNSRIENEDYSFVNIEEARTAGYLPIKR